MDAPGFAINLYRLQITVHGCAPLWMYPNFLLNMLLIHLQYPHLRHLFLSCLLFFYRLYPDFHLTRSPNLCLPYFLIYGYIIPEQDRILSFLNLFILFMNLLDKIRNRIYNKNRNQTLSQRNHYMIKIIGNMRTIEICLLPGKQPVLSIPNLN